MTDIWNLSALCRCCHKDGHFKSLQTPDMCGDGVMYSDLLQSTFGLRLKPAAVEASYCICDECIEQLRRAALFKRVVLACEHKFQEYCSNELAFSSDADMTYQESFDNDKLPFDLHAGVKVEVTIKSENSDADNVTDDGPRDYDESNIKVSNSPPPSSPEPLTRHALTTSVSTEHRPVHGEILSNDDVLSNSTTFTCDTYNDVKVSNSPPPSSPEPLTRHALTASVSAEHRPVLDESTSNDVPTNNTDCMFMCEICYKLFNDKSLLETHQHTHAKLYACDYCKKQFTLKSYLISHQRVHTREKRLTCDVCKKRFKETLKFIKHRRIHTENKRFSCDICKKQFSRKSNLIRHQYLHSHRRKTIFL